MIEGATIMSNKADPYLSGVLKAGIHDRLVADIDNYAIDAGILPSWISLPLSETCSQAEVKWVRRFNFHKLEGHTGLVLQGTDVDFADRMAAIAGALVRNFIRARVITVSRLMEEIEAGEPPHQYTCLLIPNFYIGKSNGGMLAEWKAARLLDFLLERHMAGKQTVVSVSNLNHLTTEYGSGFTSLFQKSYQQIKV